MKVSSWAKQTVAEWQRRQEQTPLVPVTDDEGGPAVQMRVGRTLGRLPGESRQAAAERQLNNAKNDLWEATHLDVTATFVADDGPRPGNGPLTEAVGKGLGGVIGVAGDTLQAVGRTLTAGARVAAALYQRALD